MERVQVNSTGVATKWAVLYLIISIVLTYAYEWLNIPAESPIKYISWLIFIGFCFLAEKEYRDQLGGFVTFGGAFGAGFRFSLFTGLLTALFTYIYLTYLSPETLQKVISAQETKLTEQGQSQEIIDKSTDFMTKHGVLTITVSAAIGTLVIGCIISLICAAILKKERTVYDVVDDTETDPTV
jgi:hypothetical protein